MSSQQQRKTWWRKLFILYDLVYFTTRVPDTSDTSATHMKRVRQEWCKCYTSATSVLHENTSVKRVPHEQLKCDTWENVLILVTTQVKTYFHTHIFTMWQVKDYKARNSFILRTTLEMPCCHAKMRLKS